MKNLLIIFLLALFAVPVQGQSLTDEDISGTWQVVKIEESRTDPKIARELEKAYFDFYWDHTFVLRTLKSNSGKPDFKIISAPEAKWNFDTDTQTIHIVGNNTIIKVEGNTDQAIFTIMETGMKLRVSKPI